MQASAGIRFDVAPRVLDEIYDNAVFPAQGTRPVFSTVHAVLGGGAMPMDLLQRRVERWIAQRKAG